MPLLPLQSSERITLAAVSVLILLLAVRCAWVPGLGGLLAGHGALLGAYAAAISVLRRRRGRMAFAARQLITVVAVIGPLYFSYGRAGFLAVPWRADAWLAAADRAIAGGADVSLWLERFLRPSYVEPLSFAYGFFLPYLYLSVGLSSLGRPPAHAVRFVNGLAVVYGLGYLGYLLLPASGPVGFFADRYHAALPQGFFHDQMLRGVAMSGGNHGAFPSLHVGVSAYLCGFELRHNRLRGWAYSPLVLGIIVATLLLRWHYLIDVLAGLALAGLGIRLAGSPAPTTGAKAAELGMAQALWAHGDGPLRPLGWPVAPDHGALTGERLRRLEREGRPHFRRLEAMGMRPEEVFSPLHPKLALFFLVRELELAVVGSLPALIGAALSALGLPHTGLHRDYVDRLKAAAQRVRIFVHWQRHPAQRREMELESRRLLALAGKPKTTSGRGRRRLAE